MLSLWLMICYILVRVGSEHCDWQHTLSRQTHWTPQLHHHILTCVLAQCMMLFYTLKHAGSKHCDWQHTLSQQTLLNTC